MNGSKIIASLLALLLNVHFALKAEAQESELRDLGLELEIAEVLRDSSADTSDPARLAMAQKYFEYHLQHPSSVTGEYALVGAFRIWNSFSAIENIEKAVPLISRDSRVWSLILTDLRLAYARSERTSNAYLDLLRIIEPELTHPLARAEVLMHLSEVDGLAVGLLAPDFTATTLQGTPLTLAALRGQVVLLEFWATWCQPCLPEIPGLKRLHETYQNEGLRIIGISLDMDLNKLRQFVSEEDMRWTQMPQREGVQGHVARQFNVKGIPRSFLLDRQGTIVAKDLRGEDLQRAIRELRMSRQISPHCFSRCATSSLSSTSIW